MPRGFRSGRCHPVICQGEYEGFEQRGGVRGIKDTGGPKNRPDGDTRIVTTRQEGFSVWGKAQYGDPTIMGFP